MTEQDQNEAIAKWMGWLKCEPSVLGSMIRPDGHWDELPNYCGDHNAIFEVEARLTKDQSFDYGERLMELRRQKPAVTPAASFAWHVSAPNRAEALLRMLRLWVD